MQKLVITWRKVEFCDYRGRNKFGLTEKKKDLENKAKEMNKIANHFALTSFRSRNSDDAESR